MEARPARERDDAIPGILGARWAALARSLPDLPLRLSYFRSELERLGPGRAAEAAEALCAVAIGAEAGRPGNREALEALVLVLVEEPRAVLLDALRKAASELGLEALERFLRAPSPRPSSAPPPAERPLGTRPGERELSLGERRALARRPSRAALARLLADPHPWVIRNLLANSALTEDDVIRLAARRPAYPDVLAELARHPRWAARPRVRRALVLNPSAPPDLALLLVNLLARPDLLEVASATDLPAALRRRAEERLGRRRGS